MIGQDLVHLLLVRSRFIYDWSGVGLFMIGKELEVGPLMNCQVLVYL